MHTTSIGVASRRFLAVAAVLALITGCDRTAEDQSAQLKAAVDNPERQDKNRARDSWRHPALTLRFMGIRNDMTVVELWPGGGWYTEILAPYLKPDGTLYLAQFPADSTQEYRRTLRQKQIDWLAEKGYDAEVTTLGKNRYDIAPAGSADMVLTFRNLHNWLAGDYLEAVYDAAFRALKPGGVLGVVEHRARPESTVDDMKKSGYVTQQMAIDMARKAGFKLEASSEINANPKDTASHPRGVWTLPPTLALGEEDKDRYLAIGESDRMTLKFVKPHN